jgi:hypothetical protein
MQEPQDFSPAATDDRRSPGVLLGPACDSGHHRRELRDLGMQFAEAHMQVRAARNQVGWFKKQEHRVERGLLRYTI